MLISVSLGRTQVWLPAKRAMLWAANLTWISLAVMVAALFSLHRKAGILKMPVGWPNRFLIVIYCTWVIVVAWRAVRLRGRGGDSQDCPRDLRAEATAVHRSV